MGIVLGTSELTFCTIMTGPRGLLTDAYIYLNSMPREKTGKQIQHGPTDSWDPLSDGQEVGLHFSLASIYPHTNRTTMMMFVSAESPCPVASKTLGNSRSHCSIALINSQDQECIYCLYLQ